MENNRISFNAIDFETSTGLRTSACAVAIVRVEKAEIVNVWNTLIKPPNNYYSQRCIDIHGITPNKTKKSPTFKEIYPILKSKIEGFPIVAHFSRFDKSVFFACKEMINDQSDLNLSDKWYCTHKLFKIIQKKDLKLNQLCKKYDINLVHHDATSDAIACAKLFTIYLHKHIG